MKIGDAIRESVVALFSDPDLHKAIVLKGGTALHLAEQINARLSTDIDFSTPAAVPNANRFFPKMEKALGRHFKALGYEVIDGRFARKPKRKRAGVPENWGGWTFQFKLSDLKNKDKTPQTKTKRALVPEGAASSKIEIEISEYEYCGSVLDIPVDDTLVPVYSATLLVLEKIRAICQQHPTYKFSQNKNRARDYYDVYQLTRKHREHSGFFQELKNHLEPVFAAKQVPLELLNKIFDEAFLGVQENSFRALADTVGESLQPFSFYSEQLKWLVRKIRG